MDKDIVKEVIKEMFRNNELEITVSPEIDWDRRDLVVRVSIDKEEIYTSKSFFDSEGKRAD